MNAFFVALSFLTRFPVPRRTDPEGWPRSTLYYPVAGLVIGFALILFDLLVAGFFPSAVRGVLLLGVWVGLTGGLHLDGLMDTADGFGSNRGPERTLEIMKDSRVGAMGVLAALFLLLLKAAVLASAPAPLWVPLLVAPTVGRWSILLAIRFYPYRREDGIGLGLREGLTGPRLAGATLITLGVSVAALGGWGLLFPVGAALLVGWTARVVIRRIGGFTGDVYGALVEGTEAWMLLLWLWLEVVDP
ncbi:cobalamin-5'-phosphate synthase [Melghirimyces profundicolus]|uniref:Adenosylcobinamide-GDP ribazoletransferase n=1 Tax=Melghirimyces profundicolus TaxID=1242148 RepID=A0A2T6C7Q7_9BACL|nr:adenosylcobinamide-GDP ribazoletransferase [Melghirimyces profundicolus]PTX64306.1 cobalamin-5'-phosphate synthase [Melghirimyces profundicolus]